jgi:hypothetical protein
VRRAGRSGQQREPGEGGDTDGRDPTSHDLRETTERGPPVATAWGVW